MPARDENPRLPSYDWAAFKGYSPPTFTQIPNEMLDEHLARLSGAEVKVLLYVARRTSGWNKPADAISLSQMLNGIQRRDGLPSDYGAGVARSTLTAAIASLVKKGLLLCLKAKNPQRSHEPNVYALRKAPEEASSEIEPASPGEAGASSEIEPTPGPLSGLAPSSEIEHTKETETKRNRDQKKDDSPPTPQHGGQAEIPVDGLDQAEERIFAAWQEATGHTRADLSTTRRKKIRERLRDKFTQDEITLVVTEAWQRDPWRDRVNHNWIEQLLKSKEAVQKWLDLHDRTERGESPVRVINGSAMTRGAERDAEITRLQREAQEETL